MTAARGLGGGSSAGLFGFGFVAGGAAGGAGAGCLAAGKGAEAESAGEFVAPFEGVASPVAGAALAGVVPGAGFVVGLPVAGLAAAGLPAGEFASVAGCAAAGVAGALVLLEAGGAVELVSVASEFCAAADGLLVCEPSHPNP